MTNGTLHTAEVVASDLSKSRAVQGLRAELELLFRPRMLRQLFREVQRDDLAGIAAEMAFYALFALFPFLLFIGSALALVMQEPETALGRLLVLLHRFMPAGTATLLGQFLEGPLRANRPYLLSIGIIGILWAGSRGFAAVLKALNRVYCAHETRSWIRQRAISLGVMLLVAVASLATLIIMTGLDANGILASWLSFPDPVLRVWGWARWIVLFVILAAIVQWLYQMVPCVQKRRRWVTPGALFASLLWLLLSAVFALYMDRANSFTHMYGAVGDVIVLMSWIYLGSYVVLLGAEINTKIQQIAEPRVAGKRERPAAGERMRRRAL